MRRGNNGNGTANPSEAIEEEKDIKVQNWLEKNPAAIYALPINPDILTKEIEYESSNGNITILDRQYILWRIGTVLDQVGITKEHVKNGEMSDDLFQLIEDALTYYPAEYNEIKFEPEMNKALAKAVPQIRKMLQLMGLRDAVNWSDNEVMEYQKNLLSSNTK